MRAERGQREAALIADLRERRNSVALHLQTYSDLLADVRTASKVAKLEIKNSADEVLRSLSNLVDDCAGQRQSRASRHLFHEMSEQIFKSFMPELSFQYELNILSRFAGVRRRLRELSDHCERSDGSGKVIDAIARVLSQWRTRYEMSSRYAPEQYLMSTSEFLSTYSELDKRLDRPAARRLLLASIDLIEKFCDVQCRLRHVFESHQGRLVAALEKNAVEEFKVRESPHLCTMIEYEIRSLGLIASLNLDDFKYLRDYDDLDALPEFVYVGAVLYTIAMVADHSMYSSGPMRY